ncbi:hypothetical protein F0562_006068 [Nyssa sinensis]|uniref:Retrotransposon gag domain-containing protein n=1 Tax=Nyssa sinensis TaxID=561372 RepID=A0A5J5AMC2_9ASTE|nr:hypothetical protein F0562_006068 [Nyssa sinensis]
MGHRCERPQLFMIEDSLDVGEENSDANGQGAEVLDALPEISFHAIAGAEHPQTLRVWGRLKNKNLMVLTDGGSTHNFIDQATASRFGLYITRNKKLQVVVANQEKIECAGQCQGLTLTIQGVPITADYYYVLHMAACQVVLGVQWLETLGPIEMDYKRLTMTFQVISDNVIVQDSSGKEIESQLLPLVNAYVSIRNYYATTHVGKFPSSTPKYWLAFTVSVPSLGFNTYVLSSAKGAAATLVRQTLYESTGSQNDAIEVGPGNLKLIYFGNGGKLSQYVNKRNLITRVYKEKEHVEVEFTVGPIPIADRIGKEIVTQITTAMKSNKTFYTDSNGRDFIIRDGDKWSNFKVSTFSGMDPSYSLPDNVAMITLQELEDGKVLIRLAHLYEITEDKDLSVVASVELKKVFPTNKVEAMCLAKSQSPFFSELSALSEVVWCLSVRFVQHLGCRHLVCMGIMTSESFAVKFMSKNYSAWEFQFLLFVMGKELWGHIDGSDPALQDVEALSKWKIKDAWIMTWILSSVEPHLVLNLRPYTTAADMWNYLNTVYNQDNSARRFQLEYEMANFTQGSLSIEEYFSGFQTLWADYSDIVYANVPIAALSAVQAVHATSKRDFEIAWSNLINRAFVPSLDACLSELLREEQRLLT